MGFLPDRTGLQGVEQIPEEIQEDGGILLCLRLKTEGAIPLTSLTKLSRIMKNYEGLFSSGSSLWGFLVNIFNKFCSRSITQEINNPPFFSGQLSSA